MVTLKEKVFNRITDDFRVLAREVFLQLELVGRMMEDNTDEQLYAEITTNERIIDSLEVKMRTEVINTIVLYTPRATNLRIIISYYDMTAYLERIGDLILNIANFLRQIDLQGPLFRAYKDRLAEMLSIVTKMTKNSIGAFTNSEPKLAKEVIELDSINRDLPGSIPGRELSGQELRDLLSINTMTYHIERIGDNATNISEAAIYLIQRRNIKHLDHQNDADLLMEGEE